MKSRLIATIAFVLTALGTLSAGAFAQSSVTLYGRLDLGLGINEQKIKNGSGIETNKNTVFSAFGAQSEFSSSHLGFTGIEDIGRGNKIFFNYEADLNAEGDTAIASTRLANIGVAGYWGNVMIGTYDNALDNIRDLGNPGAKNFASAFGEEADTSLFGGQRVASQTLLAGTPITPNPQVADLFGINTGHIGGNASDSLGYISSSVRGFNFSLSLTSNNTHDTSQASKTRQNAGIVGLNYAAGPLNAQFAYGVLNSLVENQPASVNNIRAHDIAFAVSYRIGIATPRFMYEGSRGRNRAVLNPLGRQVENRRNYFGFASTFALGAWSPWFTLAHGNLRSNADQSATQSGARFREGGFEVGTTYTLSKRTLFYCFYNFEHIRAKRNQGDVNLGGFTNKNFALGIVQQW